MNKTDVELLGKQLAALAEVFDKKPVTLKGLEVWYDTLREFPTERVMDVLNHWAKGHGKFPTPAEVWKSVNERMIDLREEQQRVERAQINTEYREGYSTPKGREIAKRLKAFLAKATEPKAWAHEIVRAYRDGDIRRYTDPETGERVPYNKQKVTQDQFDFALAALKMTREQALGSQWEEVKRAVNF